MMNLFETLRELKNVSPDPGFSEKSKRMILAMPQREARSAGMRGILIFLHTVETGAALALAGFFILLATGSFSGNKYLAPVQYSVIDPGGLHAEADAIDTQIQLANISYEAVTSTAAQSTTAMAAVPAATAARSLSVKGTTPSAAGPAAATLGNGSGTASSTGSSTLSINQALEQLSQ